MEERRERIINRGEEEEKREKESKGERGRE